ncbi:hypothetical protein cce_5170 [Crocosphaera subtropica ATCC 51142]|uniref:Uncharacterized protein n=1 Tax=Crocosphaera subtropica (strain ATCC 51142 / BH68) TaxID=43989 RepID=B1X305_CROS5|nr:hypothetical protein [Crocosphaera subtropica]ACB54516.1 hypothetical protein cce_5170 [Crocosphaera subtropica ATCC 51142]
MSIKNNNNKVWVIVSNNVPIEVYEDELTAQQVAYQWNEQSQAHITCYQVPLISQSSTSDNS